METPLPFSSCGRWVAGAHPSNHRARAGTEGPVSPHNGAEVVGVEVWMGSIEGASTPARHSTYDITCVCVCGNKGVVRG